MSKTHTDLTSSQRAYDYSEAQLAALLSPRTREVFSALRELGASTVGQVQSALGVQSKTIYYQVKKLVFAGLVEVVQGTEGAEVYRPVASSFQMPTGYQGIEYERLAAKGVAATLRKQARQFGAAAEKSEQKPELVDHLFIRTGTVRLCQPRFEEMKQKVRDLIRSYQEAPDAGAQAVDIVVVTAPKNN